MSIKKFFAIVLVGMCIVSCSTKEEVGTQSQTAAVPMNRVTPEVTTDIPIGGLLIKNGLKAGDLFVRYCEASSGKCVIWLQTEEGQTTIDLWSIFGSALLLRAIGVEIQLQDNVEYLDGARSLYTDILANNSLEIENDIGIDNLDFVYRTPYARTLKIPSGSYGVVESTDSTVTIITDVEFGDYAVVEASMMGWWLVNDTSYYASNPLIGVIENVSEEHFDIVFRKEIQSEQTPNFFADPSTLISNWMPRYTITAPEVLELLGVNSPVTVINSENDYYFDEDIIVVSCTFYTGDELMKKHLSE